MRGKGLKLAKTQKIYRLIFRKEPYLLNKIIFFQKNNFFVLFRAKERPVLFKVFFVLIRKMPKMRFKVRKTGFFSKSKIFSPLDNMNESKLAILVNPIMVRIIFIFCEKKNMPFSNFLKKKILAPFLQQRKKCLPRCLSSQKKFIPRCPCNKKSLCPVIHPHKKSNCPVV